MKLFSPYFSKQYLKTKMIISNPFCVGSRGGEFFKVKYKLLHIVLLGGLNTKWLSRYK